MKHGFTILKLGLIVYIGVKLGLISEQILPLLPTSLKSIIDYFRNEEKEIIQLEHLPFDIQIQKPRKKRIEIPSWVAKAITILGINSFSEKEIKNIFETCKNLYPKTVQKTVQNDEKLIRSILKELEELRKN